MDLFGRFYFSVITNKYLSGHSTTMLLLLDTRNYQNWKQRREKSRLFWKEYLTILRRTFHYFCKFRREKPALSSCLWECPGAGVTWCGNLFTSQQLTDITRQMSVTLPSAGGPDSKCADLARPAASCL